MTDNSSEPGFNLFAMPSGNDLRALYAHEMASPRLEQAQGVARKYTKMPFSMGHIAHTFRSEGANFFVDWAADAMRRAMVEKRIEGYDATDILILAAIALFGDMGGMTNDAKLNKLGDALKEAFSGAYDGMHRKE